MDILKELNAMMDITLKPEFELAINEVIEKSYKADIDKLGLGMAILVKSQWEQMKPYLFFAYCLGAKAQAVPEGFVLVPKEPTYEMLEAGSEARSRTEGHIASIWEAMIEAQEQKG